MCEHSSATGECNDSEGGGGKSSVRVPVNTKVETKIYRVNGGGGWWRGALKRRQPVHLVPPGLGVGPGGVHRRWGHALPERAGGQVVRRSTLQLQAGMHRKTETASPGPLSPGSGCVPANTPFQIQRSNRARRSTHAEGGANSELRLRSTSMPSAKHRRFEATAKYETKRRVTKFGTCLDLAVAGTGSQNSQRLRIGGEVKEDLVQSRDFAARRGNSSRS